jgi:hypothetical protein
LEGSHLACAGFVDLTLEFWESAGRGLLGSRQAASRAPVRLGIKRKSG